MNIKEKSLINKICAILIIIALTISDFLFVGTAVASYAVDAVKTNSSNVDFSAYFLNSKGEKVETLENNIDKGEEYLYVDVSVKNEGYFNGTIYLSENNFNIIKDENLSSDIAEVSENEVKLNQINAGSTVTVKLKIEPVKSEEINKSTLDTKTKVEISGKYVNSKNVEKDKYVDIKGTAEVEMRWKSSEETKANLDAKILTNGIYKENEEEKRIVQILVNSKINDNNYPVKNTEININVPEGVKEVKVHSRSTRATNSNVNFDESNYIYDEENEKLTIKISNEDTNKISWNKNVQDTFVITYIFDKQEDVKNKEIKIENVIKTYDDKEVKANQKIYIEEEIDGIISYSIENTEDAIYKGKIYTGEERNYKVINKINVDYLNVIDNITMKANEAVYTENEKELMANILYKETKISKEEFLNIFGEDGYITIKDGAGIEIANINKNTETDEFGKIIINYLRETKNIEIKTSKPIALGTLNIENTKTILDAGYSREQIDRLTEIKETETVNDIENTRTITLKETETVADLNIDVTKISTIADSQTVRLEATLKASDESKDLYKNPNVTITLPKEIKILSAQYASLYKNGLEIEDISSSQNENGENQIKIKFQGEQEKYDMAGGTKICLKLEIKTSKLTPSKTSSIEMMYTNENKNETKTNNVEINFESQYGLMIYNQINNYNDAGDSLITIDKEEVYGEISTNTEKKDITLNTALINNYGQSIYNVNLIGKIPYQDNEDSFMVALKNIKTNNSNAKIYYSTNANAVEDDDSWEEFVPNAVAYKIVIDEMAKEEVIKLNVPVIIPENLSYNKKGEFLSTVSCEYQNHKQANSSNIILLTKADMTPDSEEKYENQNTENGLNTKITTTVGNNNLSNGDSIYEGQTVKYKITITNNTGKEYSNVTVKANQKNGYVWDLVTKEVYNPHYDTYSTEPYYELTDSNNITLGTIETLKDGESYSYEYETSIYSLNNEKIDGTETYGTISIASEDGNLNEEMSTMKNTIKDAELQVSLFSGYSSNMDLTSGGDLKSLLTVKNTTNNTLNNLDVKIAFSSNLNPDVSLNENNYDKVSYQGQETDKDGIKIITLKISSIEANEFIDIELYPYTDNSLNEKNDIWVLAEVITSNKNSYISNKLTRTLRDNTHNIEVKQQGLYENGKEIDISKDKLNDGEKIQFVATIVNNEEKELDVDIDYNLDSMINIENAKISSTMGRDEDILKQFSYNTLKEEQKIMPGEKITINVIGEIDALEIESVTNKLNVYDCENGKTSNNSLSILVNTVKEPEEPEESEEPTNPEEPEKPEEPTNPEAPEEPTNPDNKEEQENTYTISGTAWIDKDKDGKRSSSEEKISNMTVEAMNAEKGSIVASTKTNENGEYKFNLSEGKYIIIFYHDNNLYSTTTYQVKGASELENSDAVGREITIDGITKTAGTTDILDLNKNINNIDIGLVLRSTFDLQIQKYVDKITVTNKAKTLTYEQKDKTTLAKAEIKSKYLNDSLVVIEYKIKVTNAGDVDGYARNIVDYMPSSLNFNSSMNPDWYLSGNNLYNTSLANTKIQPGETKELTLVLTKTMTESNTGLINNKAEIKEASNELGIKDETADKGSADVIISVSTGALVNYIGTTLITLIILVSLAYFTNKKYLSKKI